MRKIFSADFRWLAAAVLLPLLLLGALRFFSLAEGHENSTDVYWHMAAGRRSFSDIIARDFPLTLSVWRDHYADKELGFHLYTKLSGLTAKLFRIPLNPPFNGTSIVLMLFVFLCYLFTARKLGISPPMILAGALLCALITPNFTYRLMMVRPHVLSIGLMLLAYAFLSEGPETWKCAWKIFLLGFVYSWSYSSPHLLLIPAICFALTAFRRVKFRSLLAPAAAILGLAAGLTLHPQFPNTFLIWRVQAIDALFAPISGDVQGIAFAMELQAPTFYWLLTSLPVFLVLYLLLMLVIRALEKHLFLCIPENTQALLLLSLLWTGAMSTVSIRPVEYTVPLLTLAFLLLLREADKLELFAVFRKKSFRALLCTVLILVCGSLTMTNCFLAMRGWTKPHSARLAAAIRKHVPAGNRVVNVNWGDFPELAFMAPEYEYTWALDPMFSCHTKENAEKARLLSSCLLASRNVSAKRIGIALDADYAVLAGQENLGNFLKISAKWPVLYHEKNVGWIFRLSPDYDYR